MKTIGLVALACVTFGCSSGDGETPPEDTTGAGGSASTGGAANTGGSAKDSGTTGGSTNTGGAAKDSGGGTGGAAKDSGGGTGGSANTGGAAPKDATPTDSGRPQIGDTDTKGRKLVWADEFDGPNIDRAVWGNETGFVRNNELQRYTTDAANQYIDSSNLVIEGIYVGGTGQGSYTSASLITKPAKTFQYGRIEARIQVPGVTGSWPAFWMLPPNKGWPAGGEIDVMEFVSQSPNTIYGTAHFAVGGAHQSSGGSTNLASPPADAFHVYAVEWTATKIDWFLDTTQYHTYDTTQAVDGTPFQAPFYLLLNYAIGGSWPEAPVSSEYPCKMLVDWVRVWQ